MKLYSEACDRNSVPIGRVLQSILPRYCRILEIGSGTGQHAGFFSQAQPGWQWHPSDVEKNLESIDAYRLESALDNFQTPIVLDLDSAIPREKSFDAVVAINVIHIVSMTRTRNLFDYASVVLKPAGVLFLYGPVRDRDRAMVPSNAAFDHFLRQRDPASGIRCYDELTEYAHRLGFVAGGDLAMPANNRSIWWLRP